MKAILGYLVAEGLSEAEYDDWLFNTHAPDLLSNPHLDKLVLNKILRTIESTAGGAAQVGGNVPLFRISELHFASVEAHTAFMNWFAANPVPAERGPAGRTDFQFYVLVETVSLTTQEA